MRYRGRRAASMIDWSTIDYVVGTRADITRTGIKRPCSRCGEDVYTSRHYPERVAMICEYCALALAEEEAAERPPATNQGGVTGPLLDPWGRTVRARPRGGRAAIQRRLPADDAAKG